MTGSPTQAALGPIRKIVLRVAAYWGVFTFSLLFFIYVFFPYSRWKGDIEEILSSRTGKRIMIEEVQGWRIIGLRLNGVTVSPGNEGRDGMNATAEKKRNRGGKDAGDVYIKSIAFRPAILSILGTKTVFFSADIFGGDIDGKLRMGKRSSISIDMDDISIREIPFFEKLVGLPFIGELNGEVDIGYAGKRVSEVSGDVRVKIEDMQVGDKEGELDLSRAGGGVLKGAVKFEPIEVGDLVLKMSGKDGILKVTRLDASSKHLDIQGGGEIKVSQPVSMSMINIYVKFKFKDDYVQKSSMTRSVFSTLDRLTRFRQAKRTDGFWGFAIRGTFSGGVKTIPARVGPEGM